VYVFGQPDDVIDVLRQSDIIPKIATISESGSYGGRGSKEEPPIGLLISCEGK
jgi:hypothetical protein